MIYKLSKFRDEITAIHVLDDDRNFIKAIPFDENNAQYQEYLKWCDGYELIDNEWVKTSEGNEPEPADEV